MCELFILLFIMFPSLFEWDCVVKHTIAHLLGTTSLLLGLTRSSPVRPVMFREREVLHGVTLVCRAGCVRTRPPSKESERSV